jgi:phage terminase small subunit
MENKEIKKRKLTVKQENFCNYYIETSNASDSYRRAYDAENMTSKQIWEKSCVLLTTKTISERVRELQNEQKKKSDITKESILSELANIAFSSIANMHNSWVERKEFDKLTDKQKKAIKSISTKVLKKNVGSPEYPDIIDIEFVKIELHDKIKAIERICKMLGFDEATKIELPEKLTIKYKGIGD